MVECITCSCRGYIKVNSSFVHKRITTKRLQFNRCKTPTIIRPLLLVSLYEMHKCIYIYIIIITVIMLFYI